MSVVFVCGREGCGYTSMACSALEKGGIPYVSVPLGDMDREDYWRMVQAMFRLRIEKEHRTFPRVFVYDNTRSPLIMGGQDTKEWAAKVGDPLRYRSPCFKGKKNIVLKRS